VKNIYNRNVNKILNNYFALPSTVTKFIVGRHTSINQSSTIKKHNVMNTVNLSLEQVSTKTPENTNQTYSTVNSRKKFWNSKRRYLIS
tara:strand:- start:11229 stop:11492 length:264 start_codon:yes stop_codon:yes gene_type:complete